VASGLAAIDRAAAIVNIAPKSRRRAFTLVEVMIALMIFSGVIIAIYAAWSSILRCTKVGHAAAVEVQRDRIAVRSLEEALFGIQMFQENIRYYSFLADTSSEFAGLSFVSRLPESYPRNGDFEDQPLRRVTFTVEPSKDGRKALMLRQAPVLFESNPEEEERPLMLARDVKLFTVEFWGPRSTDWEPDWLYTNQLPRLVRFAVAFGSGDRKNAAPADVITRVVTLGSVAVPIGMQHPGPVTTAPTRRVGSGVLPPAKSPGGRTP
jgi:prepilin-type N-terminal cleavage/methylation domain-containing protein